MESGKRWLCVAVCVFLLQAHGTASDQAADERAELERAFVMLMDSQWVSDPRPAIWHPPDAAAGAWSAGFRSRMGQAAARPGCSGVRPCAACAAT